MDNKTASSVDVKSPMRSLSFVQAQHFRVAVSDGALGSYSGPEVRFGEPISIRNSVAVFWWEGVFSRDISKPLPTSEE